MIAAETSSSGVRTFITGLLNGEEISFAEVLGVLVVAFVILAVTSLLSMLLVRLFRRVYNRATDDTAGSLFTVLIRVVVWCLGVFILLKVCFNFDASFILGALGVGGIALSLGLQNTISNLLGGLQVSFSREVVIGDWVSIGTTSGVIKDINWRTTCIEDDCGVIYYIPNSVLNSSAVSKMPDYMRTPISFVVSRDADLLSLKRELEAIADKTLAKNGMAYEGKKSVAAFKSSTAEGVNVTLVLYASWDFSTAIVETTVLEPVLVYLKENNLMGRLN